MAVKKAIFPVGGLGTRFLPATKSLPKEMLPVVDKPLIHYVVDEALEAGIEEFIFVTGRGKQAIEDYFDHSYELETTLKNRGKKTFLAMVDEPRLSPGQVFFTRQQRPLGLGHAVWCARHLVQDEPFAVLLADDFIISKKSCLRQMIEARAQIQGPSNMVATLEVPPVDTSKYGILDVSFRDRNLLHAKGVVEKPLMNPPSNHAVIGRYILEASVMDILAKTEMHEGELQLTDAISGALPHIPLLGFTFEGKRYDCGNREGLIEASLEIALSHPELKDTMTHIILSLADRIRGTS